ncbi:ABC transporter permease [Geoglobus acetivorans]|uniref:ABC transporter permease n=1 Tax=Geoglobus acetivorans TaxID=565033 RepID=A0ABZ3GZD6_GEOAI
MRLEDVVDSAKDFLYEFRYQKGGILGFILLILLILAAVFAPNITSPDVPERWSKEFWVENPPNVPPTWINYFSSEKLAPHEILSLDDMQVEELDGGGVLLRIVYKNTYDVPPKDIILQGFNVSSSDARNKPLMTITLKRPDGSEVVLIEDRKVSSNTVIQIATNTEVRKNVFEWAKKVSGAKLSPSEEIKLQALMDTMKILFGKADENIFEGTSPLHGDYVFEVKITYQDGDNTLDLSNLTAIFSGRTYGLMGTDSKGRDIWAGLVWGTRVSLSVGIAVAVLSVLIGIVYGVASAYFGGWKDEALQRFNEFMFSMPVLPILILLGAYLGHMALSQIVLLLVLFGWVGVAKVARSMALQIKEQTFVEAARALGAGSGRVVFKHIMPQIMPYAFSQMALSVPYAVMTEAALSFLGIGDPTAVTWGQMLYDAQNAGATINGYWWWVIPPGLAIALVGLAFVLIGVALDRILNPRMRTL